MPTYVYRREDGTTFEIKQRITADKLTTCPTTGQAVTRVISGNAGLIFKGDGFYLTDYARKDNGKKGDSKGKSSTSSSESSSNSSSESKTETKSTSSTSSDD